MRSGGARLAGYRRGGDSRAGRRNLPRNSPLLPGFGRDRRRPARAARNHPPSAGRSAAPRHLGCGAPAGGSLLQHQRLRHGDHRNPQQRPDPHRRQPGDPAGADPRPGPRAAGARPAGGDRGSRTAGRPESVRRDPRAGAAGLGHRHSGAVPDQRADRREAATACRSCARGQIPRPGACPPGHRTHRGPGGAARPGSAAAGGTGPGSTGPGQAPAGPSRGPPDRPLLFADGHHRRRPGDRCRTAAPQALSRRSHATAQRSGLRRSRFLAAQAR